MESLRKPKSRIVDATPVKNYRVQSQWLVAIMRCNFQSRLQMFSKFGAFFDVNLKNFFVVIGCETLFEIIMSKNKMNFNAMATCFRAHFS